MQSPKVAIVAPVHIQPSKAWVDAIVEASRDARILIVDDSNGKVMLPSDWNIFTHDKQKEILGDDLYVRFTRFHRSPPCKNFGIWRAWKEGDEVIIVIDSDCIVPSGFVAKHLGALEQKGDGWENPLAGIGWRSRGLPYHERDLPIDLHMGLWTNELDLYGKDRVDFGVPPKDPPAHEHRVAHGMLPLSGMNLAFRREVAPAYMFFPHFDSGEHEFRRHDDIWGGYIVQKIIQKLKRKVSYGQPFVYHDTIVDPARDASDEEAMIAHEEQFYALVDDIFDEIEGDDYQSLFKKFTEKFTQKTNEPLSVFLPLATDLDLWVQLFS